MSLLEEIRKTQHWIRKGQPHNINAPLLRASEVTQVYEKSVVLDKISFELHQAERMAVVGPNGAGKSTLFQILSGVMKPTDGSITISGYAPGGHICIAYLPQKSQVDWSFPATVADVVMMGRIGKLGLFRHPKSADWDFVDQTMDLVDILHLAKKQINQLSGGQQQRMFIARALAQEAEIMLMDEPFSGLDISSQRNFFSILDILAQKNVSVMVAMHDLQIAREKFDRIMLLNKEILGLGYPDDVFSSELLMKAYGNHLHFVKTADGLLALEDSCCDEGE